MNIILNLLFSFLDGINFIFPFWYIKKDHTTNEYLNTFILLAIQAILNSWISTILPINEIFRELLLGLLIYCLIICYRKKISFFDFLILVIFRIISIVVGLVTFSLFNNFESHPITSFIAQSIRFIIIYLLTKFILSKVDTNTFDNIKGVMIIIIPMAILFEMFYQTFIIEYKFYMLIELIIAGVCFIFIFYIIVKYYLVQNELEKKNMRLDVLEYSKSYVEDLEKKEISIRKIRHDISARFVTIRGLIQNHKNDEAIQYINEALEIVQESKMDRLCPIESVNIFLNYKKSVYTDIDISIDCKCDTNSIIDVMDLNVILSNLIDNAAKEIRKHNVDNKIAIKIRQQNFVLTIEAMNSLSHKKALNSDHITTKEHGLGLAIVNDLVDKYNGVIDIEQSNLFIVRIILFTAPYKL